VSAHDDLVAALHKQAERKSSAPKTVTSREPEDTWTMVCFTREEAVYAYRRRHFDLRSLKQVAREMGKSVRSTARAIRRISLEEGTFGSAWAQFWRDYKRERWQRQRVLYDARDRQDKIDAQTAAEHLEMTRLTEVALEHSPRETRQERETRVERELQSGTVRIGIARDTSGNGNAEGNRGARAAVPLSPAEREARRKARRIREMLGPNPMPHELGL
jgi:hypothetical protein